MADKPVFVYFGVYQDPEVARTDLGVVRQLHKDKVIGTYDAAVAVKEADGKIKIDMHEKPTQHGMWTGLAVGAVLGVFFGPVGLPILAAIGLGAGGLVGHAWHGISRKNVKEIGEMLDEGQAMLIVVGRDKLAEELEKAELKADKQIVKEYDVEQKDFEKALDEAKSKMDAPATAATAS